jgi:hypothetical protein
MWTVIEGGPLALHIYHFTARKEAPEITVLVLGVLQRWSGRIGAQNNSVHFPYVRASFPSTPVYSPATIL